MMQDREQFHNGWSKEKFNSFMDKYFCQKPISRSGGNNENIVEYEDGTIYHFLWINQRSYKVFLNNILVKTGTCGLWI